METMLVFNINPELEEDMVDYLLEHECITGFTSYPVRGHGLYKNMNLAEQVSGRRKAIQLEILIGRNDIKAIIAGLKENVGSGISYWEQQIMNTGRT